MTAEEEQLLRKAIREAFAVQDWEGDLGFLMGEDAPQGVNESSGIVPFQVWVSNDGVANVSVPPHWGAEPYMRELLLGIANQELNAHLGVPQN